MVEQQPAPKSFKVGPIESDSGNHLVDVFSVVVAVLLVYFLKKLMRV